MSTTTQIVREAPDIEAIKVALLKDAQSLASKPVTLPTQEVAEMSGLQTEAIEQAKEGIGTYLPYIQQGGYTIGDAKTQLELTAAGMSPYQTQRVSI
jgi:hypothetical protein